MRKFTTRAMGVSLLAGGVALSLSAVAAEGLYTMDELNDADVFDSTGEEIGEVEDILLSDDMSLHSLVIETGEVLDLGGREVIAERGTFTVATAPGNADFGSVEYEVHVEMTQNELKELPEYDQDWWNQTSQSLQQAWENTKDVSENAWENTKEATSSAWYNVKQGVEEMGNEAGQATE
ncbi:PRC-barrel domain-containing protein [Marinobacter sp. 1_MG-2023]|uniref:PRC-barrel domain-containing protein n=1 Tax=Marinobacter sp. 1_MG-2023 TaxID=3062627 RepID=UPI0026E2CC4C|nr:PRC-barrel domain-containing protein [Marinobacter sp. 1_MG-2023]MDO6824991.1 PRC-barrel domain-containing protein [Marinobacter sp. 1_MG-2023]